MDTQTDYTHTDRPHPHRPHPHGHTALTRTHRQTTLTRTHRQTTPTRTHKQTYHNSSQGVVEEKEGGTHGAAEGPTGRPLGQLCEAKLPVARKANELQQPQDPCRKERQELEERGEEPITGQ